MKRKHESRALAQLAHDIRDFYASQNPAVTLWTPDCIHISTAIIYGADEMNTLDGGGKRKRPGDLLSLSEDVMGGKYPLPIRKPVRQQASILSGARRLEIPDFDHIQHAPEEIGKNLGLIDDGFEDTSPHIDDGNGDKTGPSKAGSSDSAANRDEK